MKHTLATVLISRKFIGEGTSLKVSLPYIGYSGGVEYQDYDAIIDSYTNKDNKIKFKIRTVIGNRKEYVSPTSIIEIDGMDYARYAEMAYLDLDGNSIKPPPKRGRKPKIINPESEDDLRFIGYEKPIMMEI